MNTLFIILTSYGSAGEALIGGFFTGLALWGLSSLIEHIRNRKIR